MIVGALRLPETMLGMTEASTTRKALDAVDPALAVDHRRGSLSGPILQLQDG